VATETAYLEMWAQDAAAMYCYQMSAAQACTLPPFTPAPAVTATPQTSDGTPAIGLDSGTVLGQYLQSFLSSGPYDVPLQLLQMFSVLWGVSPAVSELSAIAAAEATVASVVSASSSPTVAAGAGARISVGVGRPVGLLRVPPSWGQVTAAPGPTVTSSLPAAEPVRATPLPMALPAGAPRGGTPTKRERPQPEYGGVVRFIPRPPSGG